MKLDFPTCWSRNTNFVRLREKSSLLSKRSFRKREKSIVSYIHLDTPRRKKNEMNPQTHSHKLHLFRFASISNLDDLRCCGKKGSCKCSMPKGFCVDQMSNQSQLLWKYQNFDIISSPIYRLFFQFSISIIFFCHFMFALDHHKLPIHTQIYTSSVPCTKKTHLASCLWVFLL